VAAGVAAFLAALALSSLLLRYKGDLLLKRTLTWIAPLFPASAAGRWFFGAVCLGAGISEELAFRGFLLFYFATLLDFGTSFGVVGSSAVFGLGHLYQGWRGVLLTAFIGLLLAAAYVASGSILVPMVIHAALDLRLLIIVTPRRLRALSAGDA
jgi:membrane protease YdiL (CAAX protease family)